MALATIAVTPSHWHGRAVSARSFHVYLKSPLFWILTGAAILRLSGLFWGLPGADGWDDDGVAPRNFLVGLAETYTPGHHFTYPPFHMFILAVPCLPAIVVALLNAPSSHPHDVIATITQLPYMTYFSVVARLISIAFSLGTIVVIGKLTELLGGRRAGLIAAGALALNASLTYYGVVTNLDGPSLFWSALAFYFFTRLMVRHDTTAIRPAMLSVMAAVATKDQTYALFLLSLPLAFIFWFSQDGWARQNGIAVTKKILLWGALALFGLLLIDGALTNPHGFADRLALLTGSASKDYAEYEASARGWTALLIDAVSHASRYYPALLFVAALGGIIRLVTRFQLPKEASPAGFLPLLAALSFTLAFNFVALRTEPRFLLPQSVFLSVYIGLGIDAIWHCRIAMWRKLAQVLCVVGAGWALLNCAGIAAAFLADPRYDAEKWMANTLRPGEKVEIYGLNAYLPRFPHGLNLARVAAKPLKARNPLPGVKEVLAPYRSVGTREPKYLVVPGYWVADYLDHNLHLPVGGRIVPKVSMAAKLDVDARSYFGALFAGRLPYRLVRVSGYKAVLGPGVNAYESLAQTVFIFERDPQRSFEPIVTGPN